jgi:flagellar hook assembly protein FlgD
VTRLLARPRQAAGQVRLRYNGDGNGGKPAPAGTYHVLVVASNSGGSATAEAPLTIKR